MKRAAITVAVMLLAATPAQAAITHKQAVAALSAVAARVGQTGETVVAGGCSYLNGNDADCALWLKRPGSPGTLESGPDVCTLQVSIRRSGKRFLFATGYATGTRMASACAPRS